MANDHERSSPARCVTLLELSQTPPATLRRFRVGPQAELGFDVPILSRLETCQCPQSTSSRRLGQDQNAASVQTRSTISPKPQAAQGGEWLFRPATCERSGSTALAGTPWQACRQVLLPQGPHGPHAASLDESVRQKRQGRWRRASANFPNQLIFILPHNEIILSLLR